MKHLPTVCAQLYDGTDMKATPCTRCRIGWDKKANRCTVYMGVEHFPHVASSQVPPCPLQETCQHQHQSRPDPCPVRARGMLCESAVGQDHPLSFNAIMMEQ